MAGRAMLTCDIDERWNGPPPRCEGMPSITTQSLIDLNNYFTNSTTLAHITAIECDELPDIFENAKILSPNGTSFGARAEITCPAGMKPNGARFITCLASGQWSDSLSVCVQGNYFVVVVFEKYVADLIGPILTVGIYKKIKDIFLFLIDFIYLFISNQAIHQ